jgi:2-oxoglutarate ferredoxin oxidoreductase subunit alpha
MDYSIKIGGEAGQGIQTIGEALARVFGRAGYYVFSHQDYESRIRGGHNFYQIRLSDRPVHASREHIDILVALDKESILRHESELTTNGQVIYDSATLGEKHDKPVFLDVPFVELAVKHGGSRVMANTAATGAVLGMLGMEITILLDLVADTFQKKGDAVVIANRNAAMAGYDFAVKECIKCSFSVPAVSAEPRMVIAGVDAIGLGAVASGVKFYAAYPMTPSTGIMNYVADKAKELGIVVEQAEDEIAAINMALGASFAGVRAMTATSGGGFALMVEGLALAGMTETPVVIALGQRPGPATGFPTRTEQGELQFVLSAGHGEFPRVVFAPGTPKQAFHLTNKAFDLAEKYQIPAFVLFDTYLADSQWTYKGFDLGKLKYTDYRLRGEAFRKLASYKRHAFTETGVSPLGVPGDARHLVVTDSDEHDEDGHIVENAETRIKMVEKRFLKKFPLIKEEISPPYLYGDHDPEIVITGWGSTYGVIREAVDELAKSHRIAMLHFSEMFPFPHSSPSPRAGEGGVRGRLDYLKVLNNAELAVCVEHNATGQFARLMKAETGFEFGAHVRKFNGRPFAVEEMVRDLQEKIKKL